MSGSSPSVAGAAPRSEVLAARASVVGWSLRLVALLLMAHPAEAADQLWFDAPAQAWTEALPVGNGRIGAMVFGQPATERIQFNEQTLWTGDERAMGAYQPFGDLFLDQELEAVTDYRRELDLDRAITRTTWTSGGVRFTREVFASHPDQVVVVHQTADRPRSITLRVRLTDRHQATLSAAEGVLRTRGSLANGLVYEARVGATAVGGTVTIRGEALEVTAAEAVTVVLAAGTSFANDPTRAWRGEDPAVRVGAHLGAALAQPFPDLVSRHLADHQRLYRRVTLDLGPGDEDVPTDRRVAAAASARAGAGPDAVARDPGLDALFFQYGRYLLIASSRPGGLPANLQGIWNDDLKPAWYSGYTTNINVEMNYWLAEPTNLAECHEPLLTWIGNLATVRKKNAQPAIATELGWMIYSTNNPMGGNSTWAKHPPGSAWLSQHLWEHYAFGGDRAFLASTAYPLLKDLTRWWLTRLVPGPEGTLITPDGWSPEHGPVRKSDGTVVLEEGNRDPQPGASYDQQIVHDLFTNTLAAAEVLDVDADFRREVAAARAKLLGPRIGRWGQLLEWREDVDDQSNRHRHVSHLFAVHPGRQIDPVNTPALAAAARISLAARGDGGTGWSRAWKINFWARLYDGNRAHRLLRGLLTPVPSTARSGPGGVYPNLFDAHPPFQIDGNFGATAGIAEMLVQSHVTTAEGPLLHLLPALPQAWPNGRARGMRVRGGGTLDLMWSDGQATAAILQADHAQTWAVRRGPRQATVRLPAGGSVDLLALP